LQFAIATKRANNLIPLFMNGKKNILRTLWNFQRSKRKIFSLTIIVSLVQK
jgi:hypothetical protein